MDCIHLNRSRENIDCHAQPIREREPVIFYKPTEEEIKNHCTSTKFDTCPRFIAIRDYIDKEKK